MNESRGRDPVVLRVWKGEPADVFALFPTYPADNTGRFCTSYQHLGQHGIADYHHCIRHSRPATKAQARQLLAELRRIGYRPRVLKRVTRRRHEERLATARVVVPVTRQLFERIAT